MADVYYAESEHENAYVLYMKYLSLFIEKVSHPFSSFPPFLMVFSQVDSYYINVPVPICVKLNSHLLDMGGLGLKLKSTGAA